MPADLTSPWAEQPDAIASQLDSNLLTGLDSTCVRERLADEGPNRIEKGKRRGPVILFLMQFADLLIGLLAVAAVISAFLGDWTDTLLIGGIVLANAIIGFVQEWKADRAIQALSQLAQPLARVRRDNAWQDIAADQLVRGDLIEISAGDIVSADARVCSATSLEVNESALTGESLPAEKHCEPVAAEASLPDRSSMVFAGTAVVRGHGLAIVTATGMQTEIGRIAQLLQSAEDVQTPLQRRLNAMTRWIAGAVIVVSVIVFITGVLREPRDSWGGALYSRMLLTAVSLAVAAIPEGLPAVITITLALGSQRMARRKAIIRQLSAVETLGSVNVICSDKTGTLTQNRMKVMDLVPVHHGAETRQTLLEAAALCNNAEVNPAGEILGSATEAALLSAARDEGIDVSDLWERCPRLAELPFSSQQKMMATLHQLPDRRRCIYVKGAADRILPLCASSQEMNPDAWTTRGNELAASGRRVLAIAQIPVPDDCEEIELHPGTLQLVGLLGLADPVRPEVRPALERCRTAGIHTVMITGDHPETARAIGNELEMFDSSSLLVSGAELEKLSDEELTRQIHDIRCFARVSPEHKLRIVRALQSRGNAVSMTGDGVNDAPALKQAEIGVAMGITGTDVSKEASDLILADDNFATIVAAVEEGRIVYDNIRKFVTYLLTANFSEVMILVASIALGWPLPLLPVHLLWINLVTDGLPALALGFEPGEPNIMRRGPRRREQGLLGDGLRWQIIALGTVMAACCLGLYFYALQSSPGSDDITRPRSMIFLAISLSQLFYVCGIRSFSVPLFRLRLLSNYKLAVAVALGILVQIATIYFPPLQKLLHTVPLSTNDFLLACTAALIPLIVLEVYKYLHKAT